jgi:hypothetical protein
VSSPRIDDLIEPLHQRCKAVGADYGIDLDVCLESCWGCEVRVTDRPHAPGVDRSFVTYAVAGDTAEDAVARSVEAALSWLEQRIRDTREPSRTERTEARA